MARTRIQKESFSAGDLGFPKEIRRELSKKEYPAGLTVRDILIAEQLGDVPTDLEWTKWMSDIALTGKIESIDEVLNFEWSDERKTVIRKAGGKSFEVMFSYDYKHNGKIIRAMMLYGISSDWKKATIYQS